MPRAKPQQNIKSTVRYEWDVETVIEGEIMDHNHSDKCPGIAMLMPEDRLVLVRDVGNDFEGVVTRLWAYVVDGKLPEYFEGAFGNYTSVKVPARFHQELAAKLAAERKAA